MFIGGPVKSAHSCASYGGDGFLFRQQQKPPSLPSPQVLNYGLFV